jgi:hypothetical protein
MNDLINSLYNSFLMRDFFGKALPGSILLFLLTLPEKSTFDVNRYLSGVSSLPVWMIVVLYGFSVILGFFVQSIGEMTGWYRNMVKGETEEDFIERQAKIKMDEKVSAVNRQQRERYIVIRDLCSNFSLSLTVSSLIFIAWYYANGWFWVVRVLMVIIVILSLNWYGRKHVVRQRNSEMSSLRVAELATKENLGLKGSKSG